MRFNQHTKGTVRDKRLPTLAVSETERERVDVACDETGLAMAQLVRCGLVLLGVLDTGSLDDVPRDVAARISEGKPLHPVRAKR